MKFFLSLLFLISTFSDSTFAESQQNLSDRLFHGNGEVANGVESILQRVEPGTVIVFGEYHDSIRHHDNQNLLLWNLKKLGLKIHVGMEFIDYTKQAELEQYLSGELAEKDFLTKISWGGFPFDWYRSLVQFPLSQEGGKTIALNAPSFLTRKIGRTGLESLTPEEESLLPPNFTIGNDLYFQRFKEAMGIHDSFVQKFQTNIDPVKLQQMFTAQSLWDDTMAWQSRLFMEQNPNDVLVIIVGDFHASYGGGLADRLKARGIQKVLTISQVLDNGLEKEQIESLILPHPRYFERGDFIWLSTEPEKK